MMASVGWGVTLAIDRLVGVRNSFSNTVAALWERNPWPDAPNRERTFPTCKFPPAWKNLAGVLLGEFDSDITVVWNTAHRLVRLVSAEAWNWAKDARKREGDPLRLKDELLRNRLQAAAWALQMLEIRRPKSGMGWSTEIQISRRAVGCPLSSSAKGASENGLALWVEGTSDSVLRVLTPNGCLKFKSGDEIVHWMPEPGPDWTVEVEREAESPLFSKPPLRKIAIAKNRDGRARS